MASLLATTSHNYEDLKTKLTIDRKKLDDMLVQQPQLFSDASDCWAEAVSFRDQSKEALDELDANLAYQYRTAATDKLTEARVAEHVQMHPDHAEQAQKYLSYKAQADKWLGLVKAYEQRVETIRHLTSLERMGYFGSGLLDDPKYSAAMAASAEARKAQNAG